MQHINSNDFLYNFSLIVCFISRIFMRFNLPKVVNRKIFHILRKSSIVKFLIFLILIISNKIFTVLDKTNKFYPLYPNKKKSII